MDDFIDNSTEFVKIGSYQITREAQIILFAGFVLVSVLIIHHGFNIGFLIILLGYLISAYKVNCMQIGDCNIFAKLIALFTLFGVFYIILYRVR
jgi:hypothetical protein